MIFTLCCSDDASPDEYLTKLVRYQERYVERTLTTGLERLNAVASRSPNPEEFLRKYDHLDSGKFVKSERSYSPNDSLL